MRKFRNCHGFTVIEMLVVIAIIAILAGMLLATITTVQNRTKARLAKTDIQGLYAAFERYKAKFGEYPFTAAGKNSAAAAKNNYMLTKDGEVGITRKLINILTKHNMFAFEYAQLPGKNDDDLLRDPYGKAYIVEFVQLDGNGKPGEPGNLPAITRQPTGVYIYSTGGLERKKPNNITTGKSYIYLKDE